MKLSQPTNKDLTVERITQTDTVAAVKERLKGKAMCVASDQEISLGLSKIYLLVGLRPHHFPTMEEDLFLFTFIRNHFGRKTLSEMEYAFELAVTNQLDIDDIKVYDQFTPEYFARIMNAYKRWLMGVSI